MSQMEQNLKIKKKRTNDREERERDHFRPPKQQTSAILQDICLNIYTKHLQNITIQNITKHYYSYRLGCFENLEILFETKDTILCCYFSPILKTFKMS